MTPVPPGSCPKRARIITAFGSDSRLRNLIKKMLYPVLNERTYQYIQAISQAWDIRSGSWKEAELELVPYALKPGESALDIGANFGLYCHHLSRAAGRKGRVYAFEPVPFTYQTLSRIVRLLRLRNVTIVEKGCSDRAGEIKFEVPLQPSGAMASAVAYVGGRNDDREGREGQVRWTATREVTGEVVAIDEFLPQLDNLSLIKADIEGAEMFAFRGAAKTIDRHLPTVICEINPWYLGGFNIRLDELTGFFFDRGYELYQYRTDEGRPRLHPTDAKDVIEDNYVFVHPSRKERFAALLRP